LPVEGGGREPAWHERVGHVALAVDGA
jgi:hypothetical protein